METSKINYYKSENDFATLYILVENEACLVLRMFKTDVRPKLETALKEQIFETFHCTEISKEEYEDNFKRAKILMNSY